MGLKDFVHKGKGAGKNKVGLIKKALIAKLKWKIIFGIVSLVLVFAIGFCIVASIQNKFDTVLQSTLGWLSVTDDDDNTKEVDLYDIDTNIGVADCKLRPQTGVYPDSSGSDGLGTGRGSLPAGVPTIAELIEKNKSMIQQDVSAGRLPSSYVEARGKTKSMMGLQVLGPNIKWGGAPQWDFLLAVKVNEHNKDTAKTKIQTADTRSDFKDLFDSDGYAKVDGRYCVAVKKNLGTLTYGTAYAPGDYLDVYLDSGLIINCVVCDIKRETASETVNQVIHNDGSIIEFVVDKYEWYNKHGNGRHKHVKETHPEFMESITGIAKVGSWWDGSGSETNGGESGSNTGGNTNTGEETYLDSNGNPCTPEDATVGETEGGWAENFGAVAGKRTVKNFLQHACSAMGRVAYMWGGGQGTPPNHVLGFDKLLPKYKEYHDADRENKTKCVANAGLDCCGYVKWTVYQTFHTEEGKNDTDGSVASGYTADLQSKGFGKRIANTNWAKYDIKPGDIISTGAHIWIGIGKASDGTSLMIHSSQTGDLVHLSGSGGEAANLAKKYNDIVNSVSTETMGGTPVDWYPPGKGQGSGHFRRGSDSYEGKTADIFRWNYDSSGLEDPDGITNMSAEEIMELIIGDGKGTKKEGSGSGGGTKIFIDPGHGPNNSGDSNKMQSDGYVKNGSTWGEWRHYDASGAAGTSCNNCGKDGSNTCWYPYANGLRDKEPELTYGIATKLKKKLEDAGYEVMMSRDTASHPAITKRAKMAADWGADIQICIHTNAGGGSGVAYCSPEGGDKGPNKYKGGDWKQKSLDLNKKICDGILAKSSLKSYNSGIIPNYGYLILYEKASCPTAYLEIGFHDNSSDYAILKSDKGQEDIAEGILQGVNQYYGK